MNRETNDNFGKYYEVLSIHRVGRLIDCNIIRVAFEKDTDSEQECSAMVATRECTSIPRDYEDAKEISRSPRASYSHPSTTMDLKQLKCVFLDNLAARFLAVRSELSSDRAILDVLRIVVPEEQHSDSALINDLTRSGLIALNNWRHQFLKAIKELVATYKTRVKR